MIEKVWVFNGANSRFPGGVFTDREIAENWIWEHKLSGVLTLYPINKGIYNWAIEEGLFTPGKDSECTADFIGKFSSANQEHYHYSDGSIEE